MGTVFFSFSIAHILLEATFEYINDIDVYRGIYQGKLAEISLKNYVLFSHLLAASLRREHSILYLYTQTQLYYSLCLTYKLITFTLTFTENFLL